MSDNLFLAGFLVGVLFGGLFGALAFAEYDSGSVVRQEFDAVDYRESPVPPVVEPEEQVERLPVFEECCVRAGELGETCAYFGSESEAFDWRFRNCH